MKVQVSFREVKKNSAALVAVSDSVHHLMNRMFGDASLYAAGIFGWNADIFRLPRCVCVACGYRPQGKAYDSARLSMWYDVFRLCKTEEERDDVRYAVACDMLGESPLKEHHTASARGYVSRKGTGYTEAYRGRFGIGVVHHSPRYDSTSYHYKTYYTL